MTNNNLQHTFNLLCKDLKSRLNTSGYWEGELSSSALSTAVAMVALKIADEEKYKLHITNGMKWLSENVNSDGGFGDTPQSLSNVSTSLLCYSAFKTCTLSLEINHKILTGIENYLEKQNIHFGSGNVMQSILNFYGKDLTFSVPILSMLLICGVLKESDVKKIPQLPFEFTLLPTDIYRFFNLQVVSYAIPALVAVGIYIFKHKKSNLISAFIRNKSLNPALKKLEQIMPESGGFLEAIPLTGFVSMCLISSGYKNNNVVKKGIDFLVNQQRTNGSLPIDTNLATWVTSLSIKSLQQNIHTVLTEKEITTLRNYLLNTQYTKKHPFNKAMPGGWGWTNLKGSVPDADDTPGAILALLTIFNNTDAEKTAIINGCVWLTKLQNTDGGIPTFCKGWGRLPFDQSSTDLTGHTILAWSLALDKIADSFTLKQRKKIEKCTEKAILFLQKNQQANGSWNPLWFGNQYTVDKKNPVYGTAKITKYLTDSLKNKTLNNKIKQIITILIKNGQNYLFTQQNADGSWGGSLGINGTIEETALAISAVSNINYDACEKGFTWLENEYKNNGLVSNPIGLYFASLWYDEKMYPLTAYLEAISTTNPHYKL